MFRKVRSKKIQDPRECQLQANLARKTYSASPDEYRGLRCKSALSIAVLDCTGPVVYKDYFHNTTAKTYAVKEISNQT